MSNKISLALPIAVMELLLFIFAGSAASASSVSVSPTSINFGSVNVGSSSQQQIKITNSTAFGVTITSVTVSGNYFSISGITAPLSLNIGVSATLTVTFAPKAAGSQTGSIVVQGRGFTAALDVTLSANGVASGTGPSVSAVPTSASLGSVPVGSSNSQTFTVTNHGTTTVSVSSESVSGTGFSLSGLADGAQISAGKSSTFNVTFKPAKTGTVFGSASINFSASGKTVPLSVAVWNRSYGHGYAAGESHRNEFRRRISWAKWLPLSQSLQHGKLGAHNQWWDDLRFGIQHDRWTIGADAAIWPV